MVNGSEHGFDLTGFRSSEDFKRLLKQHKLSKGRRVGKSYVDYAGVPSKSYQFEFRNKNVKLITANNPVTGQYADRRSRPVEKGYASYIGITGNPRLVKRLATSIRKRASFIKGESKGRRDFI
jgi:hypothetical protein